MDKDIEQDDEFKRLVKSVSFPDISEIAIFARKHGITQVRDFWELFDKIQKRWSELKAYY
jgi:hypothetical protein